MESEEQTQEETPKEEVKEVVPTTALIDKAEENAKRLEEANKKQEELIKRQEDLYARQQLAGRADGGFVKEAPKEETPEEYAEKLQNGEIGYN